ncbi:MAG TPA: DUF4118 domain-containing protein [Tepidisphaeraceae bacterium]|jgi:hypothetical protein
MKADRSILGRYALCLLAMTLAVAGRAWAQRMGWGPYRFPFVQCGIILSAALGGIGPGMLAVVLGALAWCIFLPPAGRFWIAQPIDLLNLLTFSGVNILIVWAFATVRQRWASGQSAPHPHDAVAAPNYGRPHLRLQSPGALVVLLLVVTALAAFGCWGTFTVAGAAHFDDESTTIPLTCLGLAPALLIFGIGFLPVLSFRNPVTPHRASTR